MAATTREQRTERILVVEDEDAIRDLVATALRFTGFPVSTVASGRAAIAEIRNERFDLLILDVNLPDIDGFEITRKIRADGNNVAVIFLTARDDLGDLKTGFTAGGDDYLTKPFSLEELMLRIDAILRRTGNQQPESARLTAGDVSLDQDAYRVWRGDEEISLSPTEFRLLRYLMQNQDRVVSKNQILDHVWDYEYVGDLNAVETYISYLRKKLGDKDGQLIRTVRGFGYSLQSRA
ncbi:MAG TPA: response regulator transcription factor [Thermomicrobiales bacterium]|nr:response regulator transcription factor [Thermomicrobiales bacterium]